MTASGRKRRRVTQVGGVVGLVGLIAVVAIVLVAVSTLRNSNEGRAPETDARETIAFPDTPNAVIGVVDDFDRLTSLAVLTLAPDGSGGSIVAVPVNVDANNGFGPGREPISRQPFEPGDAEQAAALVAELEPLLTLTIERAAILGPEELVELIEPFAPLEVDLPQRVIDSDTAGTGLVVAGGERSLDLETAVEVFTAISVEGSSYDQHEIDVAMWDALAAATVDASSVDLPRDEFDRPVAPGSVDELFGRLFAGDVSSRDLAIDADAMAAAENEADSDFVLVDRRDALLVFGAISPSLVSKPNEAPSFMLVVPFAAEQVEALGAEASGSVVTKTSMTRRFIGELLFSQANIGAVDLTDAPERVPERTQLMVSDERLVESVQASSERFFGDADVIVSEVITDGIDVVVILGDNFLVQRSELLDIERSAAESAAADDDGEADFDVSGAEPDTVEDDG